MVSTISNSFIPRMQAVREILLRNRADGILFSNMSNIRYLSGFSGSDGILIVSSESACLLVDGRYTTQAAAEAQHIPVSQYQNKVQGIERVVKQMGLKKIGFEAAFVTVEIYDDLIRRFKNKVKLVSFGKELQSLRACKEMRELQTMKKAAAIASAAVAKIVREIEPGWTEQEVALHLEVTARRSGAEQLAFETIVASGENAALPHAKPSHRKLRNGDFVVVDFGVRYQGYCSDETCTLAIGELTAVQKNAYRAVLRAHDEAIASIRAGMAAADVDALTRRVLGKEYSRYFTHGTGHGVGLDVHEAPRVAPSSQDILTAGMVVTVEPGLYFPGLWGIRIEDTVLVKKNSCEIITKMNKKLTTI